MNVTFLRVARFGTVLALGVVMLGIAVWEFNATE